MHSLLPGKNIHKVLISSPCWFVGSYESEDILIHLAWHNQNDSSSQYSYSPTPVSRNSFIMAFKKPGEETIGSIKHIPNYENAGEFVCSFLAVLFGKRFDNHGLTESHGNFYRPRTELYGAITNHHLPQNSHKPRKNLEIPLNLTEVKKISRLLTDQTLNQKFLHSATAACRYYLKALQTLEDDPEIAFLHLITCGEILSNYYEYSVEELIDEQTLNDFQSIRVGIPSGDRIVKSLQKQMLRIKQRFTKAIMHHINNDFFNGSECSDPHFRLDAESLERRIKSAYDVRSRYVHTGESFGGWIYPIAASRLNEILLGQPMLQDKEFSKSLSLSPTFFGLERVMRWCLLSFIHQHGIHIDSRLNTVNE